MYKVATFRMYTQARLYTQAQDLRVYYKMTKEHEILTIEFLYSFFNGEKLRPIVTDEIKNNTPSGEDINDGTSFGNQTWVVLPNDGII